MKAYASSFHAWKSLEKQSGLKQAHGLVFPLAIVEAIGAPHGLTLEPEEHTRFDRDGFDAVFISVLDARNMISAGKHFAKWKMPMRASERTVGEWPLVWAGGNGLFNPLPFAAVADLIVCGEAEDPLPLLLNLWESHGNSSRFLAAAADIESVFVPSVHGFAPDRIVRGVASDIGITLKNEVKVSTTDKRRVEISRGCKFSCNMCSLGWNQPHRENNADDVVAALNESGQVRFHLQAADAESHSQIVEIRTKLADKIETGWTGRYDSALDTRTKINTHIEGWKRHAVGVEGMTWFTRKLVGKGYLTDERLIADTAQYLSMIEPGAQGRLVWHMIAGLPGEDTFPDLVHFSEVLKEIDSQRRADRAERRNLGLHWQPFQPIPGTPMQWFGVGKGVRRISGFLEDTMTDMTTLNAYNQEGRTNLYAVLTTILARSDAEGGLALLERCASGTTPSREEAEELAGTTAGELRDEPTVWDFVIDSDQHRKMVRARDHMVAQIKDRHANRKKEKV